MTIAEVASAVGSISGAISLGWIIFQWGRGSTSPVPRIDSSASSTLQTLTDTQKQITDQIYLIAQVVRDLATSLRTAEQLAAMRHEVVSRELVAVRQSLDVLNQHHQR